MWHILRYASASCFQLKQQICILVRDQLKPCLWNGGSVLIRLILSTFRTLLSWFFFFEGMVNGWVNTRVYPGQEWWKNNIVLGLFFIFKPNLVFQPKLKSRLPTIKTCSPSFNVSDINCLGLGHISQNALEHQER